jgi:hypothetical protein
MEMKQLKDIISTRLLTRRTLAVLLIVIGVTVTTIYGVRSVRSYQQLRYIREQGLDDGTASVEAIQPWMTIGYIGVAYAVPEEYIYAELDIPFDRRNRNQTLGQLNQEYRLGRPVDGETPVIIQRTQAAILAYRENPVPTGLDDIRPWMTVQYIANSTGVPEDYLFEQLGIAADGNAYKPLDLLAREARFREGPRGLTEAIKTALSRYEATP